MKRILLFLLAVLLLSGCNNGELTTDIVGEWVLIEVLADPGDGSGRFRPVNSDKRISFFANGTYISTGAICNFSSEPDSNSNGIYTLTDTGYQILCGDAPDFPIGLQIEDGFLIVSFPCIEPCFEKYRKLN